MTQPPRDPKPFLAWLLAPTDTVPPGAAPWLSLLEEFLTDPNHASGDAARALLAQAGLPPERARLAAFDALLRAGRVHPDENFLLRRFAWRREFPPACLENSLPITPSAAPEADESFAIDDPETYEVDDAVSLLRQGPAGWKVVVHIADPDRSAPFESPLDQEAQRRGTTLYLPEGPIPLFPAEVVGAAMSLRLGEARPALSFWLDIARDGEITQFRVAQTWVTLSHAISYDEADARLQDASQANLRGLRDAARALRARRVEQGALIFSAPPIAPRVNPEGEISIKRATPVSASREMVAELMIGANLAAARYLQRERIPGFFRAQEWQGQPRAPMPEEYDPVASFQAAALLGKTELSDKPRRHVGLGLPCYTQVTSPIRRYSDLLLHRQLKASLRGEPLPYDANALMLLAKQAERRTSEARMIEGWAREYWTLRYLVQHPNHEATAAVLRVQPNNVYLVELQEFLLRTPLRAKRQLSVGDRVAVLVREAHPRAGTVRLGLNTQKRA